MKFAHTPKAGNKIRSRKRHGLLITFEGIEGCGKTTQCQRLADFLRIQGYPVLQTREPGGTCFAEEIRKLLLQCPDHFPTQERLTPECEASLIFASRAQHVTYAILPALTRGTIVLCDRFSDSTLAYQGFGRHLDLETLEQFNMYTTGGLVPDLTFLFDLPVRQGLARRNQTTMQNRIDQESQAFHHRVRRGFLTLAKRNPQRITVIDGRGHPEAIASQVKEKTHRILAMNKRHRTPSHFILA